VTGVFGSQAGDLKSEDGHLQGGAISFRVPGGTPVDTHVTCTAARRRYHQGIGPSAPDQVRPGRLGSKRVRIE